MKDQQKDVGKCNQSLENRRENLKDHWKVGLITTKAKNSRYPLAAEKV